MATVALLGGWWGTYRPGWHHPGSWHPNEEKILWLNLLQNTGQTPL